MKKEEETKEMTTRREEDTTLLRTPGNDSGRCEQRPAAVVVPPRSGLANRQPPGPTRLPAREDEAPHTFRCGSAVQPRRGADVLVRIARWVR